MPAETRRWTAAEVRDLQDDSRAWPRYELVAGELLVTPAPRVVHQRAVSVLLRMLAAYVEHEELGEALTSPADIELEPENITQPDVFVVPASTGPHWREWADVRSLLLAVEIISPSSAAADRTTKRRYYQRMGVPEYWVVDLDAHVIERWTPGHDRPQSDQGTLAWKPEGARAPFLLDLPAFFARVNPDPTP